ncbi:PREDICTED: interleukin-6 receptor subunit alpha [Galeopterus variegatus]|uniref:Interleukin-6 receptor subunit alpha n=1 Tax=Galeopterus variegatus TaxID=482537 RepID=A0ABM0SDY0_GALVR|nr:PREDICTED: interleukin-6 receptor subunit alpha [Galeopterus variegatus]
MEGKDHVPLPTCPVQATIFVLLAAPQCAVWGAPTPSPLPHLTPRRPKPLCAGLLCVGSWVGTRSRRVGPLVGGARRWRKAGGCPRRGAASTAPGQPPALAEKRGSLGLGARSPPEAKELAKEDMLAVRCALLAILLAAPGVALAPGSCPTLELTDPGVRTRAVARAPPAASCAFGPEISPGLPFGWEAPCVCVQDSVCSRKPELRVFFPVPLCLGWGVAEGQPAKHEIKTTPKQEGFAGQRETDTCARPPSQELGRGEVANGVLTSLPGASVTLTCPGGEPADNATVHWVLRNLVASSLHIRWASVGRRLLLRSVQPSDSGNYSCYQDGHPAGTVHLLVDVPPEEPQLTCFRKSPLSKVCCEWSPPRPPSPMTKAVLVVRKLQYSPLEEFQEPCQYSQQSQKFSCQLAVPEGDNSVYIVSLCVANGVGSKSSKTQIFDGYEILQPDPPVNITVTAVDGKPRRLSVTWQDPDSWNSNFYRLRFELRYRAERSKIFTTWMVKDLQHHCIIYDAWSGVRHVVQLRAQEEFGHGLWSEWSPEAMGTPWTESRSPQAEMVSPSTQAPTTVDDDDDDDDDMDNILPRDSANTTSLKGQDSSLVPLPTFLVAGGSLAFGTLLCIGIVLRFKKTWKLRALKEGKMSMHPPYTLGQLVPERPKPTPVLVPLISPPVSPSSLGSDNTSSHSRPDARDPRSPYDISNKDYFFPR